MQTCVKHVTEEIFQEILDECLGFLLGLFIHFPTSAKPGAFVQLYKTQRES